MADRDVPEYKLDDQQRKALFDKRVREERERLDRHFNVLKDICELDGWSIMWLKRFKPGVVAWGARRWLPGGRAEYKQGVAPDEMFAHLQIQDNTGVKPEVTCCFDTGYAKGANLEPVPCGKPATGYHYWLLDLASGDRWFIIPHCDDHK